MVVGFSIWLAFALALGLMVGLRLGGFIGLKSSNMMSEWKTAYRPLWRWIKWLAWILVVVLTLAILRLPSHIFTLIAHPSSLLNPAESLYKVFACGFVVGWLLVYLGLKRRRAA